MSTTTVPACCICDPELCAADDTGEHCNDRSCGSCLHGCPAPDNTCCPNVRSGDLAELAAWYATNAVRPAVAPQPSPFFRGLLHALPIAVALNAILLALLIWSLT